MQEIIVEKSPSNRARCHHCGEKIGKDEPRLCEMYIDSNRHLIKTYTCWKCKDNLFDKLLKSIELDYARLAAVKEVMEHELAKEDVKKILLANEIERKSDSSDKGTKGRMT